MTEQYDLGELRRRIDEVLVGPTVSPELLVEDLETAYEELRAAEEEVRSQQDQIEQLLARQQTAERQHERMVAVMPVPVLLTDQYGVIRAANAAAAGMMRMQMTRMLGKPVFALIDPTDRTELRRYLAARPRSAGSFRAIVTFQPRGSAPALMEATLLPVAGDPEAVTWILLRAGEGDEPEAYADLPATLTRLAALPSQSQDMHGLLRGCADVVREGLGRDAAVTVSVGPPSDPDAIASTSLEAQRLDGAQLSTGEGPTFAAFVAGGGVHSRDLHSDPRWPRFGSHVAPGGGGAVAAALDAGGATIGTLTVYLPSAEWDETSARDVPLMASAAGAAVHEMRTRDELTSLAENLRIAMASRAVIEQAKGIVMAQRGCDADAAFAHLVHLSSTHHVKLNEVAGSIVGGTSQGAN